jgi:FkbM family methyltransferase
MEKRMLLKNLAISLLEKHPYGYAFGLAVMESSSLFLPHESDFYAMPLVARSAQPGLFLDVGANRGHSALGFCKVMPGWRAISIEANPLHQPRLEKLKKSKKLFDYHIVAADHHSGKKVTLWTPHYGSVFCHSSTAVDRNEAVRSIEMSFPKQAKHFEYVTHDIQTLALDDLELHPQIIKIDIQGKEIDCLRGLTKTIEKCRPSFLIECNLDGGNIIEFMRQLNYTPYLYHQKIHSLIKAEGKLEFTHARNVFFIPDEDCNRING